MDWLASGNCVDIFRQMKKLLFALAGSALAVFTVGCEMNLGAKNTASDTTTTPAPTTTQPAPGIPVTPATTPATTPAANTPPVGLDDLDISAARMLGPHSDMVAQGAAITRLLFSANVEGDKVAMSFEDLNWPEQHGKKTTDGAVYLFWQSGGGVVGGYFDAHGVGQTSKGLENVYGGYLSGQQPPRGATVYFALVSFDAAQRTNVKRSETPW
jgi:hypothetical protein